MNPTDGHPNPDGSHAAPEVSSPAGARSYITGAVVNMTTIIRAVDTERLLEIVSPLGHLRLAPVPEAPPGKHPVCIDFWRVRDGRPEVNGVDQHGWFEMAGTTLGAWFDPMGFGWSRTAGKTARDWSESTARTIGTYHEVAISIPHVIWQNRTNDPHLFVLGMWTNSYIAKWLAEMAGLGFAKRLADIAYGPTESCEVRSRDGRVLASMTPAPAQPPRYRPARDLPELSVARRWLSQPVLGHVGAGRFAVSSVVRFYDDPAVQVAPVCARLSASTEFAAGIPPADEPISPVTAESGFGTFQAKCVPVKVTSPTPLTP